MFLLTVDRRLEHFPLHGQMMVLNNVVVWFIWLHRDFEQAPERAQEYAYHDYCATVNAINAFLFLFRGLF